MKIGDIVYVVWPRASYKVELVSDWTKRLGFMRARAKPIEVFQLETGWQKITDDMQPIHQSNTMSVRKDACVLTFEEAVVKAKQYYQELTKQHRHSVDTAKQYLEKAKENLNYCEQQLRNAEKLDIETLFRRNIGETEVYISPFTGQER